jgi:hypothetical protein
MEKFTEPAKGKSSNFNFENVSKRILPQLITNLTSSIDALNCP